MVVMIYMYPFMLCTFTKRDFVGINMELFQTCQQGSQAYGEGKTKEKTLYSCLTRRVRNYNLCIRVEETVACNGT